MGLSALLPMKRIRSAGKSACHSSPTLSLCSTTVRLLPKAASPSFTQSSLGRSIPHSSPPHTPCRIKLAVRKHQDEKEISFREGRSSSWNML